MNFFVVNEPNWGTHCNQSDVLVILPHWESLRAVCIWRKSLASRVFLGNIVNQSRNWAFKMCIRSCIDGSFVRCIITLVFFFFSNESSSTNQWMLFELSSDAFFCNHNVIRDYSLQLYSSLWIFIDLTFCTSTALDEWKCLTLSSYGLSRADRMYTLRFLRVSYF